MTDADLAAMLDAHDAWLARRPGGARLDLSGQAVQGGDFRGRSLAWAVFREATLADCSLDWADLRWCDFRGADLSTASFSRSILAGSAFDGAKLNWASPELAGELLARSADTDARRRLAAWVGDAMRGPWPDRQRLAADPEWAWAGAVLARYGFE